MVRMGACRVPDRGSIPRRGDFIFFADNVYLKVIHLFKISRLLIYLLISAYSIMHYLYDIYKRVLDALQTGSQ